MERRKVIFKKRIKVYKLIQKFIIVILLLHKSISCTTKKIILIICHFIQKRTIIETIDKTN